MPLLTTVEVAQELGVVVGAQRTAGTGRATAPPEEATEATGAEATAAAASTTAATTATEPSGAARAEAGATGTAPAAAGAETLDQAHHEIDHDRQHDHEQQELHPSNVDRIPRRSTLTV